MKFPATTVERDVWKLAAKEVWGNANFPLAWVNSKGECCLNTHDDPNSRADMNLVLTQWAKLGEPDDPGADPRRFVARSILRKLN